jgi:uncharacterized protein (TIRG00374 family)
MDKMQVKNKCILILKITIAILLLWYLFASGRLSKESISGLFHLKHLQYIMLSSILLFLSQMISAGRLLLLSKTIDLSIRFNRIFYLTLVGMFFNNVIPGAVGGDVIKGYCLVKAEENHKGKSFGIVVMDRLIGFVSLIFISTASALYLLKKYGPYLSSYHKELYFVFGAMGLALSILLTFVVFGKKQSVRNRLKHIFAVIFKKSIFYYMAEGLGIVLRKRRYLLMAFFMSLFIQLVSLLGLLILGNMVSERFPDKTGLMAASSIVMLSGVIPVTPGNIGWTEFVATFGWSIVGSNVGATIFFYWRIITLLCVTPWGMNFIWKYKREQLINK